MELMDAVRSRHAVRRYTSQKIEGETLHSLEAEIDRCNRESGLRMQLITDEPEAFSGFMAHYGKFVNVRNYIALVGKRGDGLEEKAGYYGERVVLRAQQLGLNTCWVALTFRKGKSKCQAAPGEKLVCVIAVGYGATQGLPHKNKPMEALCRMDERPPDWFQKGMEAALLAPTATNQQRFRITLSSGKVAARATGGFYSRVDLGIVKSHFEIGAGRENVVWES